MRPRPLSASAVQRLRQLPFSYPEVCGTRDPTPPAGYRVVRRRVHLGTGGPAYASASERLLSWGLHRGAGLRVEASEEVIRDADAVALLRLGPLALPVRVVYVVDEPHRRGFAYGTLPGHAEPGEERFVVERRRNGEVDLEITAFSSPAWPLARAGGPVTRWVQDRITERYLRVLAEPAIGLTSRP